jgi:protein O-GlcNAc transferase
VGGPSIDLIFSDAVLAHRRGDLDFAAKGYDRVIELDPYHGEALMMRGAVHLQHGQNKEASELLSRAVALRPADPQALNNYGLALTGMNRLDDAVPVLRRAVELQPNGADSWSNLGNVLRRMGNSGQAVLAYRRALELVPDRAGVHSALGAALGQQGLFDEAIASHQHAIELAPLRADYRNNLAQTLRHNGRAAEAEEVLRLAIELSPEEGDYHAALASILRRTGRNDEAVDSYRRARDRGSESPNLDQRLLFTANYLDQRPEQTLADALIAAERITKGVTRYDTFENEPTKDRPLRIGLISSDLRRHPVGRFLTSPLSHVDQTRYALFAYSGIDNGDPVNERLKSIIPHWRTTRSVTDDVLAEMIRSDGIDIVVDLAGPTNGGRLSVLGRRPAPVACSYLGYFATTGLDTIDYVLANRWLIPDEERSQWVEQPWYLPGPHLCFEAIERVPDVAAAPAAAAHQFTFGSLNHVSKLSARTLDAWSEILARVPNSRLLLREDNPAVRQRLLNQFAARGVGSERIELEPLTWDYYEHLAGYARIDLALDPFPYNGGTTTVEALFMGVPVLTTRGTSYVSHMGESILHAANLVDWVTTDVDSYIEKAVDMAHDRRGLTATRLGLRSHIMASPLFDGAAFARSLEAALRGMWYAWCERQTAG